MRVRKLRKKSACTWRSKRGRRKLTGLLFVLPHLTGVLLFYLIPFLDVVRRSFVRFDGSFFGLGNYRNVLSNEAFLLAARNTFRFTAVCIPLLFVLAFALALLLRRAGARAGRYKSALLLPFAVPAASVVLLWRVLFDTKGLLNGLFDALGATGCDWMNTGSAFYVLVGSYLWKNTGYVVILFLAALSQVPETLYEAARMDGAGRRAIFRYITLPCIRNASYTIFVLSLLNSFKVFREAYLVAGSYPQEDIYLLQHVFNNWFLNMDVDKMAAGAVLLALVVSAGIGALERVWQDGEV